jgi:NHLM bacteriocin system ABC transporter peptidase/ATP-binding protein
MEAVECGAAALGIILGYFGRVVPLAELRQQCGVSRDGSKASSIVKAARTYGLQAKGFSKSVEAAKELTCPFIVFWQFNHFVVVEGFSRDYVYLNDPAVGHRRVTSDEFDEGFTGVILAMEPGDEFQRGGQQLSTAAGLWRRLRGNLQALSLIAAAGFLSVLPGLAIPAMAAVYLDSVVIEGRYDWFRPLIIAMVATLILKLVLQGVQQVYIRRLRLALIARMNSQFFWHLLRLPTGFYTQRFPGEIVNRMELNYKLAQVVAGPLASTMVDLLTMVIYGAVLLMFNVPLTLIATALTVFNLLYLRQVGTRRIESNMRWSQAAGKLEGFTIAGIQSIETMKASGMEDDFFTKWMGYYAKSSNAGQDLQKSNQIVQIIPSFVDIVTTVLILIIGGYYVIHGWMTIGTLVAFQGLMASYLAPVASITQLGSTLQELRGDLIRLDDVLANPKADEHSAAAADRPTPNAAPSKLRLEGELELKGVTFGYSPLEPPLIEDLSFKLRPGERVALVGSSGSGKSTIARLICGLYQPWSGEIMLDGRSRQKWPEEVLSQSLGMVEQQIMLFEGTMRDNLTLWDKSISDRALERAAEDANIDDVIRDLPGTFSAELNEGGTNLSGGQRQRLEIARALVCDPAILVLDEATSALDSETEAIIDANLRRRGCTCVIVAHRLSTIRDCNEIIVLDRGKVVERGTHEELWQAAGHYAALLRFQDTVDSGS